MNLTEKDIASIKEDFKNLQSTSDITDLINSTFSVLYPDNKIKVRTNQIVYYADRRNKEVRYKTFNISKKDGSPRHINAPVDALKRIQRAINLVLSVIFEAHPNATGFVKGKSLLDNAKPHVGKYYIYNIDLKDFFPSITYSRVKAVLQIQPFNLPDQLATLIANLCCDEGRLPQGAPTSPILSNIICTRLDRKLKGLAKKNKASYTRYADDLTFSAYSNVFSEGKEFRTELEKIIDAQGFKINNNKIRLQGAGYRQVVTGIVVNCKPNLERATIRNIRSMLDKWNKLGYGKANEEFKSKKIDISEKRTELISHLAGKLSYMKMIRGKKDELCQKYENQFRNLLFKTLISKDDLIRNTLMIWGIMGIEKARAYFNMVNIGNIKAPHKLFIKSVGPVRKNNIGLNQRWVLFEDYSNHKKGSFVLFENQYELLWNFIAEGNDFDKTVFPGEVVSLTLSKSLLIELGIVQKDTLMGSIIGQKVNIPLLYDGNKSVRYNISASVLKQVWGLVLAKNN